MTIEDFDVISAREILIWLSRATGIGYKRFHPLIGNEVDPNIAVKVSADNDRLCRDITRLHQELLKSGFRRSSVSGDDG
jgi:hypothetical protein